MFVLKNFNIFEIRFTTNGVKLTVLRFTETIVKYVFFCFCFFVFFFFFFFCCFFFHSFNFILFGSDCY